MAAIPGSVPITGFLAPTDSTDVYAATDSLYQRGGTKSVADATARNAYGTSFPDRCTKGMLVALISDLTVWQLNTATPVGSSADWTAFGVIVAGVTFNPQTANYTLVLTDGDDSHWIEMNVATANTLTVPTNASVAIPIGRTILFSQFGAGQVTLTPAAGVTFQPASSYTTRIQGSCCGMTKRGTNDWYVFGDLT